MVKYFQSACPCLERIQEGPIWKDKQRPETERPYEKCLKAGAESLTDGELLAVLIRCGTKNYSALELAFALLDRHPVYKGLAGLYHLDMEMLKTIPGIGNVKAIEILCYYLDCR